MNETSQPMKWASALSTRPSLEGAVREVVDQLKTQFDGVPDLGVLFISSSFTSEFPRLLPLLQDMWSIPNLVGCSGGGVIGMNAEHAPQEVENAPALSLSVASLPGVLVRTFYLSSDDLPDLDSPPNQWTDLIGVPPPGGTPVYFDG